MDKQNRAGYIIPSVIFILAAYLGMGSACAENEQPATLINQCMECHGSQGEAAIKGWPPIAGQDKQILIRKLQGYRNQLVKESVMGRGVHDLDDRQINEVADYFSALPAPRSGAAK